MTILWPATLPPPLRRGYSVQPDSAAVVTPFPAWPIARPVQSDAGGAIQLSFALDMQQQAILDAFFCYDLLWGTRDLLMPIKASGTIEARVVNFLGTAPRRDSRGARNETYTASVILRTGTQMSADTWAVVRTYPSLQAYYEAMQAREDAVNGVLPITGA